MQIYKKEIVFERGANTLKFSDLRKNVYPKTGIRFCIIW